MGQFYQTLCAKIVTGSQCSVKNLHVNFTYILLPRWISHKKWWILPNFWAVCQMTCFKKNIFNLFSQKDTPCKNGGLTLMETSKKSGLWDHLLWYWRQIWQNFKIILFRPSELFQFLWFWHFLSSFLILKIVLNLLLSRNSWQIPPVRPYQSITNIICWFINFYHNPRVKN